jgi:hypothetical protein
MKENKELYWMKFGKDWVLVPDWAIRVCRDKDGTWRFFSTIPFAGRLFPTWSRHYTPGVGLDGLKQTAKHGRPTKAWDKEIYEIVRN